MENPFNTDNTPKRSTLLTVFLVLTFIGSGISFLSNAYVSLAFEQTIAFVEDAIDDDSMVGLGALLEQSLVSMERLGVGGFILSALLALVSLIGATLMWKLNKFGFHFYASAQIIMLFAPMLFGMIKFPGMFETLLTAIFIFVYARELKVFAKTVEE